MKPSINLCLLLPIILNCRVAIAGRPVFHSLSRNELIERSDFIFSGWPSNDKALFSCPSETGKWWVHKVYRGDKGLENKVISIAENNYRLFNTYKSGKLPSYEAYTYKNGSLNKEQSTSFLFTNKRSDGCFELAANGAQEHRFSEFEIIALLAERTDCPANLRGFEYRADRMPVDCKTSADCKIFYAHPETCHKPYIWNSAAEKEMNDEFMTLKNRASIACSKNWEKQSACTPQIMPVRCKSGRCEKDEETLIKTLKQVPLEGTMTASCAPHDASSVMLNLRPKNDEYPLININWWGQTRPLVPGRDYNFNGEGDLFALGVQASYCPQKGNCLHFKKLKLNFRWTEKDKGTLDYQGTLMNDEDLSGSSVIESKKSNRIVGCG